MFIVLVLVVRLFLPSIFYTEFVTGSSYLLIALCFSVMLYKLMSVKFINVLLVMFVLVELS